MNEYTLMEKQILRHINAMEGHMMKGAPPPSVEAMYKKMEEDGLLEEIRVEGVLLAHKVTDEGRKFLSENLPGGEAH